MSEEQSPDIDEIKEEIKIPVEEDDIANLKAEEKAQGTDVMDEFKKLGRQFAEAVEEVWNSEERVRVEQELREGVHSFVNEVDKVIREAKESETFEKVKGEAAEAKANIESSDFGVRAREGFAQGLTWMSEELGKLAQQMSTPPKAEQETAEEAPAAEKAPESE